MNDTTETKGTITSAESGSTTLTEDTTAATEDTTTVTEAISVKEKNKVHRIHILLMVLTLLAVTVSALLLLSIRYMFKIWAGGTVQELVYTMTGNLEGVNSSMVINGILQIALPALLLIAVYVLLQKYLFNKKTYLFHLFNLLLVCVFTASAAYSVHTTWTKLNVSEYLDEQGIIELHTVRKLTQSSTTEIASRVIEEQIKFASADEQQLLEIQKKRLDMSFIDANFVDPAEVEIVPPQQKRNLILIFLESMETTYADKNNGGAYDINYMPELTALSQEGENFSGPESQINGAEVLTYSTWTMAGIFAHTAGLPLNIPIGRNQMSSQETFLPLVTSLGDILEKEGYFQEFQCGSDVTFGGRKAYFKTHGNYYTYDLADAWYFGEIPNQRKVWWGYEDSNLFRMAKKEILKVAEEHEEPFVYSLLTVDTHYPDGYTCELCGSDETFTTSHGYRTPYGNVISCSSKQVTEFVDWIKEQDFYENTTVVLLGDHLTMDTNFCSDIDSNYVRKTYVSYLNSAVEPELDTKREYVTEDSFPTILASLGYKIRGNKLGLGTNLFSSVPTLIEEYGYRNMNAGITQQSDYMNSINSDVDITAAENNFNVYHSDITVSELNTTDDTYTITVSNITSSTGIGKISLALSTYEDESDTVWVTAYRQPDETYQAVIRRSTYDYNPDGTLKIEAYVYDWSWNSHFLSTTYLPLAGANIPQ